jgi:hypothetical protein
MIASFSLRRCAVMSLVNFLVGFVFSPPPVERDGAGREGTVAEGETVGRQAADRMGRDGKRRSWDGHEVVPMRSRLLSCAGKF